MSSTTASPDALDDPPEEPAAATDLRRRPVVSEPLGFVPALDGLRAVAVLGVLLYHARFSWLPGGFLGVSLFFTLSGFLITSLLLREWNSNLGTGGSIDLRRFWSRRFRRLLPASVVTVGLIVVMGAAGAWNTEQLRALRGDVPASLAQAVNWYFIAQDRAYGDSFVAPSPLEHFWSLAVEQQFYVVLPLVLAFVLGSSRRPAREQVRTLAVVLGVLVVVSAALNGWLARSSVDRAYFGTDTRMAELLIGSLLGCAMLRRLSVGTARGRRAVTAAALAAAGLTGWMWHSVRLDDGWLYPWGLLVSALCTVALIAAALGGGAVATVLAWRPLVWLGGLSYGVYLLHWPIFKYLTPLRTGLSPVPLFLVQFAVTLVAAMALARWVERPIRRGTALRGRAVPFVAFGTVAAVLAGTYWVTRDLPARESLLEAADTPPPPPPPVVRATVLGDQLGRALTGSIGDVEGLEVQAVAADDCGLAVGGYVSLPDGAVERDVDRCSGVRTDWVDQLVAQRPDVVVVTPTLRDRAARRFSAELPWAGPEDPAIADFLRADLVQLVDDLRTAELDVVLATAPDARQDVAPAPVAAAPPTDPTAASLQAVERQQIEDGRPGPVRADRRAQRTEAVNDVVRAVGTESGVEVLELRTFMRAWPEGEFDPAFRAPDGLGLTIDGGRSVGEWLQGELAERGPSVVPEPTPVRDPDEPLPPAPPAAPRRTVAPGASAQVLVVGDSVAYGIGGALATWGEGNADARVAPAAKFGCAVARGGSYRFQQDLVTFGPDCDWGIRFPELVAGYRPDVVVLSSGIWEVVDRRLEGDDRFRDLTSPDVARFVLGEFLAAIDTLAADGATVVVLTQPRLQSGLDKGLTDLPESEPARIDRLNELLAEAVGQRPDVARLVDMRGWLAAQPGGELDPVTRPDGIHFTDAFTPTVADWLGPQLLAIARGQTG